MINMKDLCNKTQQIKYLTIFFIQEFQNPHQSIYNEQYRLFYISSIQILPIKQYKHAVSTKMEIKIKDPFGKSSKNQDRFSSQLPQTFVDTVETNDTNFSNMLNVPSSQIIKKQRQKEQKPKNEELYNRTFNCQQKKNEVMKKIKDSPLWNTFSVNQQSDLTEQQINDFNLKRQICVGISHPRIREMIFNHKEPEKLMKTASIQERTQELKGHRINLQLLQQRKWLQKKGKKYLIDFDNNERRQMKYCFNALDEKKEGSIGIDQLEQLLLSVGLMESRQQVKQLIDSVDQDKSGKIQFSEFLKMILNDQGENEQIVSFFKFIINSNRRKQQEQKASEIVKRKQQRTRQQCKLPSRSVAPNNLGNSKMCSTINQSNFRSIKKKISLLSDKENINPSFDLENQSINARTDDRCKQKISRLKNFSNIQQNQKSSICTVTSVLDRFPHPKKLPFGMVVSHIRRKHMMTALKIGTPSNFKQLNRQSTKFSQNKSYHSINNIKLRSSQNMKESNRKSHKVYEDQDVKKGQNVMKALKKMWDRRLLRHIRQSKKQQKLGQYTNRTNIIEQNTKSGLEHLSILPNLS